MEASQKDNREKMDIDVDLVFLNLFKRVQCLSIAIRSTGPKLGRLMCQIPNYNDVLKHGVNQFNISERKHYRHGVNFLKRLDAKSVAIESLFVKNQITKNLEQNPFVDTKKEVFTHLQAEMFSIINSYQDLYYPQRTFSNAEEIRYVLHHNARLSKKDDVPEEFRDQGLVRPKVLIILPFKDAAYKTIQMLINIILPEDKGNTFQGNTHDDFKIGITVTKKSLKLYANFYSSDIIVASPLGLRTIIGAEGEPERDYDFLASIELLILDQTELFLMQNWDHIFHIFNHMHLQPKDSHGTDFSRNYAGKFKIINPMQYGCISQVFVQLPHIFHRFDALNASEAIDARFNLFVSKILPQQREILMKQTLIFIPNYFDFVRIRNYFKKEDLGFVQICEYSKEGKVARARDMFYHGDAHFLLYTERFHFFNRKQIKGIRHIVFYQLPCFPHFYFEMCNLMQAANMNKKIGNVSNMSITVIYSKYDVHQLSAIVGTERSSKMIQSERKVHMMVTGVD
ncbi:hypothetical protein NQ317_014244 [Molorchus minor]|uniref:Digestive organ expansion factor homolog n=1 Tax=Molorchus minor TaxID=1323400 RepID=A0ABQ9J5V9_9CUCU|nr:hypothetical protein NQ317_014244 [Molorchus minor]